MRIGTRGSALALTQARQVAALLGGGEIVQITTGGDRGTGVADKSRWVTEIEDALIAGEIDIAVHSAKDLPCELPDGLELLGTPARASSQDVLCGAADIGALPAGARVGTSSIRRAAQLRAAREEIEVVSVRGNVDTRLGRLADPSEGLSAIVLARAGLERLGLEAAAGGVLDPARFVPAPGQGAIAIEGRARDGAARAAVDAVTDETAFARLLCERECARRLGADCHTPLGAHATASAARLSLRAWVGLPDGSAWAADELDGSDPAELGAAVAARLLAAGAGELLSRAQEMAAVGR